LLRCGFVAVVIFRDLVCCRDLGGGGGRQP